MANQQFRVVEEEAEPQDSAATNAAAAAIALALKALSQRALMALSACFALLTVGSAFWLALSISVSPTPYQLVTLGLYLAFVVGVNLIVRRV